MYQLLHLLSEQKSLLNSLASTSILEDSTPRNMEIENNVNEKDQNGENKQKIVAILEKVEGCKVNFKKLLKFCVVKFFKLLRSVLNSQKEHFFMKEIY